MHCLILLVLSCTPAGRVVDFVYLGTNAAQAVTLAQSINAWDNSKVNGQIITICQAPASSAAGEAAANTCSAPEPSFARLPWQQNTQWIVMTSALEPFLVNQLPPKPRLIFKLARIGFNVWAIEHNVTHRRTIPAPSITVRF